MGEETGQWARVREVVGGFLRGSVDAHPGEGKVMVSATAYYFLVLCAYYVIRPIRDDIGASTGAVNLAWLFTGGMVGILLVHPLYTTLVSRLRRRQFINWTYRFFILNLIAFYAVFRIVTPEQAVWAGRVFYIWTGIFNLLVVSVFWSLITDVFRPGQGKRLFGVVAVGGTVGAMSGSTITTALVGVLGPLNLMLVSALILELAVRATHVLDSSESAMRDAEASSEAASAAPPESAPAADASREVIGGGVLDGIAHTFSSPYLGGVASLILFFTVSSTFLYFQQVDLVARVFGDDREARTRVFAVMDLAVNALTLVAQLFLTGRFIKWLGVGAALAFLPIVTMIGFGAMGIAPILSVFVVFNTIRRAGNFAIQRPGREALFTVLARTDKYKAKNFTDTTVYRLGDQVGAWSSAGLTASGLGPSIVAFTMVPFAAVWLVLALWLGRQYAKRERAMRQGG